MKLPEPYYEKDGIVIYNCDCREILPLLPKVDLVLTSPPYLDLRTYTIGEFDWDSLVPCALSSVNLTDRGQVICNLGVCHRDGEVVPYWDSLTAAMRRVGFRMFGWYVWDKGMAYPGDYNGRFAPVHEFVFHYNRSPIALLKTVRAQRAGESQAKSMRDKDGVMQPRKYVKPENTHKVLDSVIRCAPAVSANDRFDHPAVFPRKFPEIIIGAFPAQTILDPFMGSGTTLVAAKNLGKKAIGIEIEEKYCEIAVQRLAQGVLDFAGSS